MLVELSAGLETWLWNHYLDILGSELLSQTDRIECSMSFQLARHGKY